MTKDLRIVLLGKTGCGKSSTGNTLLGREAFLVARGLKSGTERCQWADTELDDLTLQVTDTPGLCDTHRPEDEVMKEVGKSVAVARPGPHVILMVLRADSRFTKEEFQAYLSLKKIFGDEVINYMIIVFVGIDALGETPEEQRKQLNAQVQQASGDLRAVLEDASHRYFGVNNKANDANRKKQATELIQAMKDLVKQNSGHYFANAFSQEVEEIVKPLVEKRMRGRRASDRHMAERETNDAIVKESEEPGFFRKLIGLVQNRVVPAVKTVLHSVRTVVDTVEGVVDAVSACSLM